MDELMVEGEIRGIKMKELQQSNQHPRWRMAIIHANNLKDRFFFLNRRY